MSSNGIAAGDSHWNWQGHLRIVRAEQEHEQAQALAQSHPVAPAVARVEQAAPPMGFENLMEHLTKDVREHPIDLDGYSAQETSTKTQISQQLVKPSDISRQASSQPPVGHFLGPTTTPYTHPPTHFRASFTKPLMHTPPPQISKLVSSQPAAQWQQGQLPSQIRNPQPVYSHPSQKPPFAYQLPHVVSQLHPRYKLPAQIPVPSPLVGQPPATTTVKSHPSYMGSAQNYRKINTPMVAPPASMPQQVARLQGPNVQRSSPSNKRPIDHVSDRTIKPKRVTLNPKAFSNHLNGIDIVKPLDLDRAIGRLNPATMARDILRAAAKHPTEKPLNAHLDVLRKTISAVDSNSDLATFRWDLVDSFARDPRNAPQSLNPPPHIPSPIYISSASSSPRLNLNQDSTPLTTNISSDLASSSQAPTLPSQSTTVSTPQLGRISPKVSVPQSPLPQSSLPQSSLPQSALPQSSLPQSALPQSALPQSSLPHSSLPQYSVPQLSRHKVPVPKVSQRPSTPKQQPSKAPTTTITTRSPLSRQPIVDRSPPKNILESIVMIPTPPKHSMPVKKTGRTRKADKIPAVASPNYQTFDCQWNDCPAQLHNLLALDQHLRKVHLMNDFMCRWKDCEDTDGKAYTQMVEHVQEKHLNSLAWTLGDGPVVTASGEPSG
ncbi:hypothetical protein N7495_006541 [Penicillium taxi]|uniref:uncharacterized protein n=1 Tax=Penicillium taxi TaxID=168475 RepID=UPI002544E717|nr:uncharacterized protein N7495_006541 [Penicillium taxi]KAJ5894850.1 hypothetical protein N7495_006541 [Penicillium taxi]